MSHSILILINIPLLMRNPLIDTRHLCSVHCVPNNTPDNGVF